MLHRKPDLPRGILHIGRGEPFLGLERFEPSAELRPFVEHYWAVTWTDQPRTERETVPHPSVHLVLEPGMSKLHGVHPRRFTRIIEGSGRVLGVKFRPGGFRAFADRSVAKFTDMVVHPETVFGPSILELEAEAAAYEEAGDAFEPVDAFLRQRHPVPTKELTAVTGIVRAIAGDRSVTRAELLVEKFGVGVRRLQRLFREYVGVSPKWVIQRYRLIEAAERIRTEGQSLDFVGLALELGYSDQAHFIRDFKSMVGMSPAKYRKSLE
jgi:AraC-like DNA-binding protein